jgi:hypothetical protein
MYGVESRIFWLSSNSSHELEKADQLSLRAGDYITCRGSAPMSDRTIGEDVDGLRIARAAFAGFRSAVEHSRQNSRVRALGLT